ncbi:MAG: cobyrinic acid a,c-diamide synthase [Gammaproteobacteria bacterium]|jgi:cobyrinic acid a,c-diamide synthase
MYLQRMNRAVAQNRPSPSQSVRGLIIAAPSSGSGKTTITLALLRALRQSGVRVGSMKIGPDFIDPMYHQAASGRACVNLDDWAMSQETFARAVAQAAQDVDYVIAEGVMGLFDGSGSGRGSTADVAARLGWPVILVLDVSSMAASAAALARGFIDHRDDVNVLGVILNRLGSASHRDVIERALAKSSVRVLGALQRDAELVLPSRHLGLVQAGEHPQLHEFIDRAARWLAGGVDLDSIIEHAESSVLHETHENRQPLPALGQRIAIARDAAFGFNYGLTIEGWRAQGASIEFFSPLANEAPPLDADAVYLPGGYPELHAQRLGACRQFLNGVRVAAARGACVYGECGGFMVLGDSLIDRDGTAHAMCGLLPVTTSFESPKMTLGYREVQLLENGPLGEIGAWYRGHEFHYARIAMSDNATQPLFKARNAARDEIGTTGLRKGTVFGSFIHLVDRVD